MADNVSSSPRNSNIELLRIVAMMMIVANHFITHSSLNLAAPGTAPYFNMLFAKNLASGGKLGVDIFILITGYFLANKRFDIGRVLKTWGVTLFYSITIFAVLYLCGIASLKKDVLLHSFMPVTSCMYWFVTCYVMLLLVHKVLNAVVEAFSKREFLYMLAAGFVLLSIIPSFFPGSNTARMAYSNMMWFIFMYFTGAFIRRHVDIKAVGIPRAAIAVAAAGLAVNILYAACDRTNIQSVLHFRWSAIREMNSPFMYVLSASILVLFLNISIKSPVINTISKATFAVYLIHDNSMVRSLLWRKGFSAAKHIGDGSFVLYAAMAVLIVFAACCTVDAARSGCMGLLRAKLTQGRMNG